MKLKPPELGPRQVTLRMIRSTLAITIALGGLAQAVQADTRHAERTLQLDTAELRELDIEANEGELLVTASDTAKDVRVIASIAVKGDLNDTEFAEFMDTWIDLDLFSHGRSAQLVAKISAGSLMRYQPRIDLTVELPRGLNLKVLDSGGTITISGLEGELDIVDGSGKIVVRDIIGDVGIEDGAGSILINNVTGDIEIMDLTGNLTIENVDGTVFLNKRSGKVKIDGLSGDLVVEGDSTDDIDARGVKGQIRKTP